MSKRYILTVTDELGKHVDASAKRLGISDLDYLRFLITKDKEKSNGV